jgi:hypothetical protein
MKEQSIADMPILCRNFPHYQLGLCEGKDYLDISLYSNQMASRQMVTAE